MKRQKKGFTLIELVVVVLIIGILASVSVPYYYKTVEASKATDSVALGHLLGNAYRMFRIDQPAVQLSGPVTNTCNSNTCAWWVQNMPNNACRLVACSYVAQQDWGASSYDFFVGASCGGSMASCTRRKPGAAANYQNWGYNFSMTGACSIVTGTSTPDCPKF